MEVGEVKRPFVVSEQPLGSAGEPTHVIAPFA